MFYEARAFDLPNLQDRRACRLASPTSTACGCSDGSRAHCSTPTSLLPGEKVRIYEFDRYRRVKSSTERVSVHTSFRQTMSALSQSRRSTSTSAYTDTLVDIRTHADTSVSAGGGLAGFFGAPQVKGDAGIDTQTTVASGLRRRTVTEQFAQIAVTASQAIEAERSLVVSRFEETGASDNNRAHAGEREPLLCRHVLRAAGERGICDLHARRVDRVAPGRRLVARRSMTQTAFPMV